MKKMLIAALGLSGLLASCSVGTSVPSPDSGPVLRTTLYEGNTPVACQSIYDPATGNYSTKNTAVVEFGAYNFTQATIQLMGSYGNIKAAQFTKDDLRLTGDGKSYLADVVMAGQGTEPIPTTIKPQIVISPNYYSVKTTGPQVGSFSGKVTITNGTETLSANTTNAINVYASCTITGRLPSQD